MKLGKTSICVTIVALLGWVRFVYLPGSGLEDSDFYWHITYGSLILESGLPPVDTFTWSMAGTPYQLTQWLGELCMGWAYENFQLLGTSALGTLLMLITLIAAWRAAACFLSESSALCIAILCNVIQIIVPMRPQLFSFAGIALLVYLLAKWRVTRKWAYLAGCAPLMALWVNLHGGYAAGLIVLALFILLETAEAIKGVRPSWLAFCTPAVGTTAAFVALALLATLANPYGWKAWAIVLEISRYQSSAVISEWQPVNLTGSVGMLYLMVAVPWVGLMLTGRCKPSLPFAGVGAFLLIFGYLANRQVAIMCAGMAPVLAEGISRSVAGRTAIDKDFAGMSVLWAAILIVPAIALTPLILERHKTNALVVEKGLYPVEAVNFLEEHGLIERVFTDTNSASYLIHRRIKVYIDGRMDLFKDDMFFRYLEALMGGPGWRSHIAEVRPSTLLLKKRTPLRQLAISSGNWRLVFEDDRYSVLVLAQHQPGLKTVSPTASSIYDQNGRIMIEKIICCE